MLGLLSNRGWRKRFSFSGRLLKREGGVVYVLFPHVFPEKVSWASSFVRLGFYCLTLSGEDKVWTFQHVLGNWSDKFHTWGSRELARKNTRLPHYFNGFSELLGRGLIIAASLSGGRAGVFLKFRWTVKGGVESTLLRRAWASPLSPMYTLMAFPLVKAEQCTYQTKPGNHGLYLLNVSEHVMPAMHGDGS